jgi:replication initiation and membrane attachment protein DnaB
VTLTAVNPCVWRIRISFEENSLLCCKAWLPLLPSLILHPEDGSAILLRNFGLLSNYITLRSRKRGFIFTLWEPQIRNENFISNRVLHKVCIQHETNDRCTELCAWVTVCTAELKQIQQFIVNASALNVLMWLLHSLNSGVIEVVITFVLLFHHLSPFDFLAFPLCLLLS